MIMNHTGTFNWAGTSSVRTLVKVANAFWCCGAGAYSGPSIKVALACSISTGQVLGLKVEAHSDIGFAALDAQCYPGRRASKKAGFDESATAIVVFGLVLEHNSGPVCR